jgi:hypothetical protein
MTLAFGYSVFFVITFEEYSMATLLSRYIVKEAELKKLQDELDAMKNDERFAIELEFKDRVLALMSEYGRTTHDVMKILEPSLASSIESSGKTARTQRRLKRIINPHTQEVVETRGGNHKQIRAWKDEYGSDEVESWSEFLQ